LLSPRNVASTTQLGVDPDWVEALAFAWLARQTMAGRPGNVPRVTGARGARVLGCIYPA
jgi:anhydro-N-acetylmuramic acid kinase